MFSRDGAPWAFTAPLRRIEHPKGDVLHALKCSDPSYIGFGEAYFSSISPAEIKGWKQHQKMHMNLVVPVGNVRFHIHSELENCTKSVEIGERNYCRLTVGAGLWLAFEGVGSGTNLILNLASIEHDPTEALNADLTKFPIKARQ